ncbi:MAG: hypothetical protein FJ288_11445 [Planctomycetes bacterium]|nr:hypothetical protein [Planctomycetota bacterium]
MAGGAETMVAEEAASFSEQVAATTERDVLRAILKREYDGLPLNRTALMRQDRALHNAILRVFRSWDQAMRAAGIDPDSVRCYRRWSRRTVIESILRLAVEGRPLNAAAVQKAEPNLASAALRWFRSWDEALDAAGIAPARWTRRVPTWTRERVIRAIQSIHAGGRSVSHAALRRNSVTRAATLLFGSWDAALRAACLDPETVRLHREPWTPDEVVREIRRKARACEPLNAKAVSPYSLRRRGRVFFGSWDAALSAAGLDPAKVRKSKSRGNRRGRRRIDPGMR